MDEQLEHRDHTADKFASGAQRFVVGCAKKVLLANAIGQLWDVYLATPVAELTTLGAWLGILAFSFNPVSNVTASVMISSIMAYAE